MDFIVYDLAFLIFFCIITGIFLYKRRKNLKKEGIMYLYRTQLGIKFIEWFAKKNARWLKPLQYFVIAVGYALMAFVLYLMIDSVYIYIKYPIVSQVIRAPPIFPIFPYFNKFFGLSSFFPDLYFTYFIVAIAVLAVFHEFAHGIFARLNKVRIKSTGFGFLGPILADLVIAKVTKAKKAFRNYLIVILAIILIAIIAKSWIILLFIIVPFLGAFVEQNDKDMDKASKTGQLAILAAGVFTNIVLAGILLGFFWLFFLAAFQPQGVSFGDYAADPINISQITSIDNQSFLTINNNTFLKVVANNTTYYTTPQVLEQTLMQNLSYLGAYEDTPAFNSGLRGVIIEFDGKKVSSRTILTDGILAHNPGDAVEIKTIYNGSIETFDINLGGRNGKAFLGISSSVVPTNSLMSKINMLTPKINDYFNGVVYESRIGDFGIFIFNFFWWLVILNALVALFNMLPLGPFDGGRFFMITIWGITGNKKYGEKAFSWATWFLLALLAVLMVKWVFTLF